MSEVGPAPLIQVPIQRSDFVGRDHKLKVNGIDYSHQFKVITTLDRDGKEFKRTIELKKIGEDSMETSRLTVDGKEYEENLETSMSMEKLAEFKKNWEKNWKPSKTPDFSEWDRLKLNSENASKLFLVEMSQFYFHALRNSNYFYLNWK